jgi:hypothetical protein
VRGNAGQSYIVWLCDCDCGNQTRVTTANLRQPSSTRSCGCYKRELQTSYALRHGHSSGGKRSGVYNSWAGRFNVVLIQTFENYGFTVAVESNFGAG